MFGFDDPLTFIFTVVGIAVAVITVLAIYVERLDPPAEGDGRR